MSYVYTSQTYQEHPDKRKKKHNQLNTKRILNIEMSVKVGLVFTFSLPRGTHPSTFLRIPIHGKTASKNAH